MSPPENESGPVRGGTPETGPDEKFGSYLNALDAHGSGSTTETGTST